MMQLSEPARHAQLDALGSLLAGGELRFFSGKRSNSVANPLVHFAVKGVSKAAKSRIEVSIEDACLANREGEASWYAFVDRDGKCLLAGDVGAEVQVTPSYFVKGTRAMVDRVFIEAE